MNYTIRLLNKVGAPASSRCVRCRDDDEALELLARVRHSQALELWQDSRLVWRFEAQHIH